MQKKKLSETQCRSNSNTLTEKLVSPENIPSQLASYRVERVQLARYNLISFFLYLNEVYHQPQKTVKQLKVTQEQFRKVIQSNEQKKKINQYTQLAQLVFLLKKNTLQPLVWKDKKDSSKRNMDASLLLLLSNNMTQNDRSIVYIDIINKS